MAIVRTRSSFYLGVAATAFTIMSAAHASEVSELPSYPWSSLYVVNENTLWVGSDNGVIAVSENAGQQWQISRPGGRSANLNIRQIIAHDNRHAFILSSGRGERSRLLQTRNAGFSWRQLYRGNGDEFLHCFAMIADGESYVLGESLAEDWHVIRSSNASHWISTRSGFAERAILNESASNYGNCVAFSNNTWAMGTKDAEQARLIYKSARELRFRVVNTPLSAGQGNGIHAVYPLGNRDILIAGGAEQGEPELYRYQAGEFTELPSPPLNGPLTHLVVSENWLIAGNANGVYRSNDFGASWQSAHTGSMRALACSEDQHCWVITRDGELTRLAQF